MEKKAGCFALSVFLMSCDGQCSMALPHGAVGWSVVCDCGISLSYSLAFYYTFRKLIKKDTSFSSTPFCHHKFIYEMDS